MGLEKYLPEFLRSQASTTDKARSKVVNEHIQTKEQLDKGFSHLFGLIDETLDTMKKDDEQSNGHGHK